MFVVDVAAGADTQANAEPVHPSTVPPVDGAHTNDVVDRCNSEACNYLRAQKRRSHQFEGWFRDFTEEQIVSIPDEDGPDVVKDHLLREEQAIASERKRFFPGGRLYEGQLVQIRANHTTENGANARIGDVCEFTGCDDKNNAILIRQEDKTEMIVGLHEAQSEYFVVECATQLTISPECLKWKILGAEHNLKQVRECNRQPEGYQKQR